MTTPPNQHNESRLATVPPAGPCGVESQPIENEDGADL